MNLLKCLTCGKIITSEESKSHTNYCNVESKDWKTIHVESIFTLVNDNGENCALIKNFKGTAYRFIEKRPNLVEYTPELNSDQPTKNTTKNDRFGHRTEI